MKARKPDIIKIITDGPKEKTKVNLEFSEEYTDVHISSEDKLNFVELRWNFKSGEKRNEPVKILGDTFERGYGDLSWDCIKPDKYLPWYFAVSNGTDSETDYSGRFTECFGVGVRPGAFCSWLYDENGITLILDCRNGGAPVLLNGRTLHAARIFFREYRNTSSFRALQSFCSIMSPDPIKYDGIIYGSNNWYYAYGNSSADEILSDTDIIAELTKTCKAKPFMVIDDGWTPHNTTAPWIPSTKFKDMKLLAGKMKDKGVIPGIWVRFLIDEKNELDLPEEARRGNNRIFLDPTHPCVKKHIEDTVSDIVSWGYKLIKHDYSSYDISLGVWGKDVRNGKFHDKGEGFYDRTKTTAEIVVDFYRLILESAKDTVILGCNTFSHLCAGLVHINRIGDDTSGTEWSRTRKMGINSLAFRMCQNKSFYINDADCVGIMGPIDWNLNKKWLELVSRSGTSLFVSCKPTEYKGQVKKDLTDCYPFASEQADELIPLDWMDNIFPSRYLLNGKEITFNWYTDTGSDLIN